MAVPVDPRNPNSETLPCLYLSIQLGGTKTTQADEESGVLLIGSPAEALRGWLEWADISKRAIGR